MGYISIKETLGCDIRYWEISNSREHWSHHSYRNSPIETDDSCANCNGAGCEGCELIIEQPHFEFAVPCNVLERAVYKLAPQLTVSEVKDMIYSDSHNYVYHEGEKYMIEYPKDAWLREAHPEIVEELNKQWNIVEIGTHRKMTAHNTISTCKTYSFNSIGEARKFYNKMKSVKLAMGGTIHYERDDMVSIQYDYNNRIDKLDTVDIFRYSGPYGIIKQRISDTASITHIDKLEAEDNGDFEIVEEE